MRNIVCTLPLHCRMSNLEGTDYIIVSSISKAVSRVPTVMEKHGKAWKKILSWKVMEFLHCLSRITHEKFR